LNRPVTHITDVEAPPRHARGESKHRIIEGSLAPLITMIVVILLIAGSVIYIVTYPMPKPTTGGAVDQTVVVQTEPSAVATPRPPDAPDVIVKAGPADRLEIPDINFDSAKLCSKAGKHKIMEWTQAMNVANDYVLSPPEPWPCTVVWDSTIAGGGLFGTNAKANGIIAAHTTPWDRPKKDLGAFQYLYKLKVGAEVAITTPNGKVFYTVVEGPKAIPKGEAGAKYRSIDPAGVVKDIAYLFTCNRGAPNPGVAATTENLFVTLQYNQELTNQGAFSK